MDSLNGMRERDIEMIIGLKENFYFIIEKEEHNHALKRTWVKLLSFMKNSKVNDLKFKPIRVSLNT